jgi:hypothetical protein
MNMRTKNGWAKTRTDDNIRQQNQNQMEIIFFFNRYDAYFIERVIIKNHNYRACRLYDDAVQGLVLLPD